MSDVENIRKLWLAARAMGMREVVDPTPIEMPALRSPQSLQDQIREWVRHAMAEHVQDTGEPTFEDEDDFELDDGEVPLETGYQREYAVMPDDHDIAPDQVPPAEPSSTGEAASADSGVHPEGESSSGSPAPG